MTYLKELHILYKMNNMSYMKGIAWFVLKK